MLAFCDRCTCSVSLSPPPAALDSAAPCRGAFQTADPQKPPLQGEVPPQAAEGCGAWPCHYPFGPPQPLRRGRCFASARKFAPSQGSTGRCKHRPLRSTGQGSARLCRISPSARRQCTPQSAPCGASSSPYRGAFQAAAPRKASPAREGAAAAQKQPRTVFWVRGCFAGMRSGRLGVSGRRIPGWLSPKQRLPVWRAEHWPGRRRRRRAATADAAPPEFVPPPRCRPPAA